MNGIVPELGDLLYKQKLEILPFDLQYPTGHFERVQGEKMRQDPKQTYGPGDPMVHFLTDHLLTRTCVDTATERTGKRVASSYKRNTKLKKNPSIQISEDALRKEKVPSILLHL